MRYLVWLIVVFNLNAFGQDLTENNSIFIFTRSTALKVNYIAKDFNLSDSLSTHIGVGYKIDNEYKIYNVSYDKVENNTALICEDLETFIGVNDIVQFSIWKFTLDVNQINRFKKAIKEYLEKQIIFDKRFQIKDDDAFYCSEFVYNILNKTDSVKFGFEPISKELNEFYAIALGRKILKYIPVDFFQTFAFFEKVDEESFIVNSEN
ncbi:MAG: hypothetical protein ABJQ39_13785 [Winogradskyella arenosi]